MEKGVLANAVGTMATKAETSGPKSQPERENHPGRNVTKKEEEEVAKLESMFALP